LAGKLGDGEWTVQGTVISNIFPPMEMQNMQNFKLFSNLLKNSKKACSSKKQFIRIAQIFFSPYSRKPLSFFQKVSATSLYPSRLI
jgi:hypothetical protein